MSFDVNWDIDKHKEEHESDDHWQLRRNFMECWKKNYPEERLVCLGRVFANIEFMGCRYPQEVMQEVTRMSKEVNKHLSYNNQNGTNLSDSSANVQSSAYGYTSAEHKNYKETTQDSVSFTTVYPNSYEGGPTNQGYGQMWSPYPTEAMQALVRIPEGLRPPYCNSFINENIHSQLANNNSTGITKPSNIQSINSVSENSYQNNNSANHLLSWQNRDPRIQASASIQMQMDISQQVGIQSMNLQANKGMHTDGTQNYYENCYEVNAQSSNNDIIPELQDLPDVAMASCSQQFTTLPHQIAHGNLIPPPQVHNAPFENNYNVFHSTHPKASKEFKRKMVKSKSNIFIGDKRVTGPKARRYAYWLNAGKTEAEAEYLCHIPVSNIPEYQEIKEKLGSICQMKKLRGTIIPAMKKKPKSKKNLGVQKNHRKEATKKKKESFVEEPENTGKLFGHKNAITLKTDRQGCSDEKDSDGGGLEVQYNREVKPFSGMDEEIPLEERGATLTDGTLNDYESISHSVNAPNNDITPGLPVLPDVAMASCSHQFSTLSHQSPHSNLIPASQGHNVPFGNNYNDVHVTYPKASKEFKRQLRKTKLNIVIGDKRVKGSMARRYAYWLNAGKTVAEAEYLCQIPVNDIPEYQVIKDKIGSICQMKKLEESTIPTMKKKPKSKTNLVVENNDSNAATKTKECVNEPENCGTIDNFPVALKFSGKKVKKRYNFWKKMGKSDKEAVILCKQSYVKIRRAREIMAEANRLSINWQKLALTKYSQSDSKKPLEAKSVNPTQPKGKAEIKTNEDPDIVEITTKDPEAFVISDDEENNVTGKELDKLKLANEAEKKRFNWWIDQGKSEEEATVLSKKPMAISDSLNHIANSKPIVDKEKNQEKDRAVNVKKNESRKDNSQIRDHQKKLAKSRKNVTDENQLKIYISEFSGKIGLKESLRIRDAIAQCISDYDGISMPSFGICQGVFVAICADETSRDLLDKQIPTLEPWKGARLNIVDEIEDKVFAQLFIRTLSEGGLHKLSKNIDILEKLHQQNPKLGCNNWLVFNTKSVKDGLLLKVRFGSKCNVALKTAGYKLRWFSRYINVMLVDKSQKNNNQENKLIMLNPPNVEESAPSITEEVSTVMPQSEVVESPLNEATLSVAPSNHMTPNLAAPQQAGGGRFDKEKTFYNQDKVVPSEDMIDSHDYSHDERVLATQSHEFLGVNRFSDRQSQRDAEYSRNDEVFVERHYKSPREVFYEHEDRTLEIGGFPDKERVLDGHFTENREFDRLSQQCPEDRSFDRRNPVNLNYTQETGLVGRFEGYSREDREFDSQTDTYFSDRNVNVNKSFSQNNRDTGRGQEYSFHDRDWQRDAIDRPRSSTHEIWPIQAPNRPYTLGNNSNRSRSPPRGPLKYQSTYNDRNSYRPRRKRAKKKN